MATAKIRWEDIDRLIKEIPIVLACEYIENVEVPSVTMDNTAAARETTEYLIRLGHRRIGILPGPPDDVLSKDRLKGYCQALERHNLPIDDSLIQHGDYTAESGYDRMMKFLNCGQRPTALFASNDEMAIGAIRACNDMFVRVPEEISIIGFDDNSFSEWTNPKLTTVFQPKYNIGKQSLRQLHNLIKEGFPLNNKLVLPYQLIERGTTAFAGR
ncbi:substrate-binding domain-containing protein [Paenibacillus frigoriresistens]|nr:substrate-binding domain-containing protein [Paenibacillus frigoriresistens]